MRAFCRIAARDGRPGRAGVARGGLGDFIDAGPAPAGRGTGRPLVGGDAAVAAILVLSPASCRGRPPTSELLPWPERCSACIHLITHSKIGPAQPGRPFRRAGTAAGRQPFGVDARLCVGGVVIRPWLHRKFGFLLLSNCEIFVEGRRRVAIRMVPQTPANAGHRRDRRS